MGIRIENIPKELSEVNQCVAWKKEITKDGREAKVPYDPNTGNRARVNDPSTFGTFEDACKLYKRKDLDGIGFVFTAKDHFTGIDLDNCRDPKTKIIQPWAKTILQRINSYSEISPSGKGIKIIAIGDIPKGRKNGNIEIYNAGRFFTLTGRVLKKYKKLKKRQNALTKFYQDSFKSPPEYNKTIISQFVAINEEEIIKKAKSAKNGEEFESLWNGIYSDFKSHSEADLRLCKILAFWTGNDLQAIDRLFRKSGLFRKKWDELHSSNNQTYGERTISKAISLCKRNYNSELLTLALDTSQEFIESAKSNPKLVIQEMIDDKFFIRSLIALMERERQKYESFLMSLKNSGVTARDLDVLRKVITSEKRKQKHESVDLNRENQKVKDIFPDAPISDNILIPSGYDLNEEGIFRIKNKDREKIASRPIFIQSFLKNVLDRTEYIRIVWLGHQGWTIHTVSKMDISDSKKIIELSNLGCPVNSVTAPRIVEYLSATEAINFGKFKFAKITHQMGWQGENKESFLWGKNLVSGNGELIKDMDVDTFSPDEWPQDAVFFKGHDAGENQLAKAFHKKGKFIEWKNIIPLIENYPLVAFSIYASLAPPLLDILDAPNFIIDWSFQTSSGKTTVLKIAGSCWGNPNMKEISVVNLWNATRVWLERATSVIYNLPLILDDTKTAKNHSLIGQLLYDFSSGQGRGRGSKEGMRSSSNWKTLVLSCGESKAVNFNVSDGGTHARVLSLWGSPFGKRNAKKAKLISRILRIINNNYGHPGYTFVSYLIKNKSKWDEWRIKYRKLMNKYRALAGSNEVALRQCEYFAAIDLTARLAKRALNLTLDYEHILNKVFEKAILETSESDRAKEALHSVLSWTMSNKDFFHNNNGSSQPLNGWYGIWNPENKMKKKKKSGKSNHFDLEPDLDDIDSDNDDYDRLKSVAYMPHQLEKFLKGLGYEHKSIIRSWNDKGWLDVGESKGLTKKVSMKGGRPRCYVLPEKTIRIFLNK